MSNRGKAFILLCIDIIVLFLGFTLSVYSWKEGFPTMEYLHKNFLLFSIVCPLWMLMFLTEGLYTLETFNPGNLSLSLLRGTVFSALISLILHYLLPSFLDLSAQSIIAFALVVPYMLYFFRLMVLDLFSNQFLTREIVLIGSSSTLELAQSETLKKPFLGYRIRAFLTPEEFGHRHHSFDEKVRLIAIERKVMKNKKLYRKVFSLLGSGVELMDLAHFTERVSGKIPIVSIDESWFIEHCGHRTSIEYDIGKNLIDRAVALLLMFLLIPVAIILIPLLLIIQGRPIFFKQVRVGLNNKTFTLYKLRTMITNAEKNGPEWSKPGDSRITPLGKFLRKSRLDELPQLYNILKGEMSLVGPRPERPEIIKSQLAPDIPYFNLRHLVKPGVTGWAQVCFRYGFSKEDSREKLQFDLFYVKNRSLWLDILIIIKTIKTVLTGAGQ